MPKDSHTLIWWGAGATASLGMRTTYQQGEFLKNLARSESKESSEQSLSERVDHAIGENNTIWARPLAELLLILGDGNEVDKITQITPKQSAAMRTATGMILLLIQLRRMTVFSICAQYTIGWH